MLHARCERRNTKPQRQLFITALAPPAAPPSPPACPRDAPISRRPPSPAALAPIPPQQARLARAADVPRGMTASVSAYTTLEALLIFQSLKSHGVTPAAFSKTSELLKANPDVAAHPFFQPGRLSPDALRSFYLERLRREIELEHAADSDAPHPENPRKRKAAGPPLPSVQDSLKYDYLMPKLLEKLYWTWRTEAVAQIRAEEDALDRLQREIKGIERGEWDDQLRERVNGKASSRSPSVTKKSPRVPQSPLPQPVAQNGTRGPDGPQQAAAPVPKTSPRKKKDQRPATSSAQPIAASPGPPPNQQQQPPPPPNAAYNGPPYPHLSPFPPGQQPLQPSPQQSHARPHPQSPAPGPPGQQYQQSIQPYGPNGQPQYGPPGPHPPFPPNQRFPQQGPHSPSLHTSPQQKSNYVPHPVPPAHPPPHANHPPPPQAGFMLPPFQVSPQNPSHVHQATTPQYPQVSTPINKRSASQQGHQTPSSNKSSAPPLHPGVLQARQSFSTPVSNRSPQSASSTPQSAKTRWKQQPPGTPGGNPGTARPVPEAIDDFVPLSAAKQSPAKPKSQRKARGRGKAKDKEPEEIPPDTETQPGTPLPTTSLEVPASDTGTRQGRSRRKAPAKRGRPGSVASSRAGGSVRGRSRSRSVLSHTETIADTDSQTGHKIKTERRGSLDDGMDEEPISTPSHMTTRRRGAAPTTAPYSTRRKRNAREASLAASDDTPSTPSPNRTVIAYRNFHRTCQVILDEITSHKHASTFANAVKESKADGYYEIVKRPTDLSAIKKALNNGAKYVNAIASDTPIASPGGVGATIELPISSDVVPPKAIVNPAQLEKELMRMFVNAMMFNPGEEGVVTDAREMFESVQRSVSTWRNVHGRGNGREHGEGTPVDAEEEATSSKRRKV